MSVSRLFALFLSLLLAGCNRPMGDSDGVSPDAGIAPRHNVEAQTVYPGAGHRPTPNPGGDGKRAAAVIDRYRTGVPVIAPPVENADGQGDEG